MHTVHSQLLEKARTIKMADDPDFVPPTHNKKGSLLYGDEESRRRRSVSYQLKQLKQESDESGSEDIENEDAGISVAPVSHDQDLGDGVVGGEVNHNHQLLRIAISSPFPHSPSISWQTCCNRL